MEQNEKRHYWDRPIVRLLIGATVFAVSAGFFALLSLGVAIKHGEKVSVPNVVNKSVVEALGILSERDLELRMGGARNSALIPADYVLSQDPISGTVVKQGTPVTVTISLGSKITVIPNLVGKTLREARVELNHAGLTLGHTSKIHHNSKQDTVLGQSLTPDAQVERDIPLDILVSLGPRPREYRLPNFIGQSLDTASRILNHMGLDVGHVTSKLDISRPQATILDQDPRAGSLVHEGTQVALVMSTLYSEGERTTRKFAVFLYQVPYGFKPKSVRIEVTDPDGQRTLYNEVDEPGATIRTVFGYSAQCTVRIYLDNTLESERIFK